MGILCLGVLSVSRSLSLAPGPPPQPLSPRSLLHHLDLPKMRTAFLASLLALASFVAAAPVTVVEETAVDVAAAEPSADLAFEDSTEVVHALDKRANKCSKASQCKKNKSSSSSSASSKKVVNLSTSSSFSGKGTWYTQNGVAGSCGKVNPDSALIIAMNTPQVSGGAHCGKYVTLTNQANGKSVRAKVADECPGCSYGSLDLSLAAFKAIGNLDTGVLSLKWTWS